MPRAPKTSSGDSSSRSTSRRSNTSDISSTKPPSFIDEFARVATPELSSFTPRQFIGAEYGRFMQGIKINTYLTSGLAQHLVPDTYPFPNLLTCVQNIETLLPHLSCPPMDRPKSLWLTPRPSPPCWPPPWVLLSCPLKCRRRYIGTEMTPKRALSWIN